MSHSRELIAAVLDGIVREYPPEDGFKAVVEKRLLGQKRNVQPDIQMLDAAGKVVCVVEIGYTRPEKISYYRDVGIRDVRWYDKSGVLHSSITGHVTIEYTERRVRELPDPADKFYLLELHGADCGECMRDHHRRDDLDEEGETGEYEELAYYGVTSSIIVANNKRRCVIIYCDECGALYHTAESEDELNIAFIEGSTKELDLDSFDSIRWHTEAAKKRWWADRHGVAISGITFAEAQEYIRQRFPEFELHYDQLESFPAHSWRTGT